jgi:hypothetical protein
VSEEDQIKLAIGLASAVAGWLLAQFTSVAKTWLQHRKIKRLLIEELRDIEKEIGRVQMFYSRQLQIVGAQGIGNEVSTGISNPIFKNYYKDALLSLNQNQRISFQMIHNLVDRVNSGIDDLKMLTAQIQNDHLENGLTEKIIKLGKVWAEKNKAEYANCASLQWQVKYHLTNKSSPDLSSYTNAHEDFCRYLEQADLEAKKFIESGKSIDRSKFEKTYDPELFRRSDA